MNLLTRRSMRHAIGDKVRIFTEKTLDDGSTDSKTK